MKGSTEVLNHLNEILVGELTAINQYFLHAKMCKDWGYKKLYEVIKKESIDEMKHADALTERILFLEGLPNFQRLFKLNIGQTVPEQLDSDLKLEMEARERIKMGIEACFKDNDHATRELLEHILADEENHIDWIEAQQNMIKDMGIQNYLSEKI